MTAPDFIEFRQHIFDLHRRGEFGAALDALEGSGARFPDERNTLVFWQACFYSLLGSTEPALDALRGGLASGEWWHPSILQNDSDLAPLQGRPEFEQILEKCQRRLAEAQTAVAAGLLELPPPARAAPPYPCLLALHGMGSRPDFDAQDWRPAVELGWFVALPQSSQLLCPGRFHWTDAALAEEEILGHWRALSERGLAAPDHLVLGGFSQGGARVIEFALRRALPCRGVIAVAPGRIPLEGLEEQLDAARLAGLRIYLIAGGEDPRKDYLQELGEWLTASAIASKTEWHAGLGHAFPADMRASLRAALAFIQDT